MKTVSLQFPVLEERPDLSDSPQGNRVLECVELSAKRMRLLGKSRMQNFGAVLSSPFDGALIRTRVQTISSNEDSFWTEFQEFSPELINFLKLCGLALELPEHPDQTTDIGV